jgi:hypothetical protein
VRKFREIRSSTGVEGFPPGDPMRRQLVMPTEREATAIQTRRSQRGPQAGLDLTHRDTVQGNALPDGPVEQDDERHVTRPHGDADRVG